MSTIAKIKQYFQYNWAVTNGYRQMLRIALPLIVSMGTATVMEVTDRLFLSYYSVEALAASVPASSASLLFMFAVMGVTGYVGVFIAHYTGAKIRDRVGTALWQSIYLSIAGGLLLASLWFVAEPLFRMTGAEAEVLHLEVVYFRILSVGGIVALLGYSVGCFFTGRGHARQVMYANMIAAIANIPLNYALIFGKFGFPELGIAGAGIATVAGWLISFVILAFKVFTKENDKQFAVRRNWRINFSYIKRILRYGLPSGMELFMEMLAGTLFIFMAGYLGREALAASNIAFTVNSLAYLPMVGIYTATSILVGQGMGAKNIPAAERAVQSGMHIITVYMVVIGAFFVFLPQLFTHFFGGPELTDEIRHTADILLRFVALYCLFDCFCLIYFGALKGAGDTVFIMVLMTVGCVVLAAGSIAVLYYLKSLYGIWAVFTGYIGLMGLGAYLRFKGGKWKTHELVGHHDKVYDEPAEDAV